MGGSDSLDRLYDDAIALGQSLDDRDEQLRLAHEIVENAAAAAANEPGRQGELRGKLLAFQMQGAVSDVERERAWRELRTSLQLYYSRAICDVANAERRAA